MRAPDGKVRHAYAELAGMLDNLSINSLVTKQNAAEELFRRLGITFAVYARRRLDRAADPLRSDPAHPRPLRMGPGRAGLHPAGQGDQRLSLRHLSRPGDPQGGPRAARTRAAQFRPSGPEMLGRRAAQQRLRPYRRHRSDPHRRARLLRARGQCAHALRRFLRARESRDHDAALSRCLCRAEHLAGRQLPRAAVGEFARRGAVGRRGPGRRAADAGPLQQRLFRACVPRRADGHRAGRGRRSVRARRLSCGCAPPRARSRST